jgi:hypothetical protein
MYMENSLKDMYMSDSEVHFSLYEYVLTLKTN